MGIIRPSAIFRLMVVLLMTAVCVVAGLSWLIWLRGPGRKITDQELLREAVADCKRAGQSPPSEIFEQQAGQGYYDDAMATSKLFIRGDEQDWAIEELAKIRTENGDAQGAKAMIAKFSGTPLSKSATKIIALAQAGEGDIQGALETGSSVDDETIDKVLLVLAEKQISAGDFDGALQTSERMKSKEYDSVFYDLGAALKKKGDMKQIPLLASHMKNRELSKVFVELAEFRFSPREVIEIQPTSCDAGLFGVKNDDFASIDAVLEENRCSYVSFVAIRQYATDPRGAEHLLRSEPINDDRVYGLGQIAITAAKKGDIADALRLFGDVQNLENSRNPSSANTRFNGDVAKGIAHYWTIKMGPNQVLKWARSRPDTEERVWALLGMAQALAHARPLKNQPH